MDKFFCHEKGDDIEDASAHIDFIVESMSVLLFYVSKTHSGS